MERLAGSVWVLELNKETWSQMGTLPLRASLLKVIISIAGLKEVSGGDVKGCIGKVRA